MLTENYFPSKDTLEPDEKISVRREFFCRQMFGFLLFCVGFAGGILIGIYVYHGGPDSVVTCQELKDGDKTELTATLPTTEITVMQKKKFTYAIKNRIQAPHFIEISVMDVEKYRPLIHYMEKAVDNLPTHFTGFKATYLPKTGFSIDSINNATADDKLYWSISNKKGPLAVGVSHYIPMDGDFVLFNFTVYHL